MRLMVKDAAAGCLAAKQQASWCHGWWCRSMLRRRQGQHRSPSRIWTYANVWALPIAAGMSVDGGTMALSSLKGTAVVACIVSGRRGLGRFLCP
jgi:hypothetical protein